MAREAEIFWKAWQESLSTRFVLPKTFDIRKVADVMGGFTLTKSDYRKISSPGRAFLDSRVSHRDQCVMLRGLSYYSCDPQIHVEAQDDRFLLHLLRKKLLQYSEDLPNEAFFQDHPTIFDWIAALSILEYVLNDLTTAYWFLYRNLGKKHEGLPQAAMGEMLLHVQHALEVSSLLWATVVVGGEPPVRRIHEQLLDLLSDRTWLRFWIRDVSSVTPDCGSVRSIREGDSLPLIYSGYTGRLRNCLEENDGDVLLVSNAFGGLNLGLLMSSLAYVELQLNVGFANVAYSQHRSSISSLGATNVQANWVPPLTARANSYIQSTETCVVVIDDAAFTGNSYSHIRSSVLSSYPAVFFLPLTFDVNSLRVYQRPTRSVSAVWRQAQALNEEILALCERPAAFVSFWDWTSEQYSVTKDERVKAVLHGGDQLLKTLWLRYNCDLSGNVP